MYSLSCPRQRRVPKAAAANRRAQSVRSLRNILPLCLTIDYECVKHVTYMMVINAFLCAGESMTNLLVTSTVHAVTFVGRIHYSHFVIHSNQLGQLIKSNFTDWRATAGTQIVVLRTTCVPPPEVPQECVLKERGEGWTCPKTA